MLQVKNLTFAYTNKLVLKNLNFSIEKGEHVSIIGESGSGKSTLLKLIYGEYDLNNGQIFWNKTEILGPKYNLVIGYDFIKYVAQEFDLMPFTSVTENVGQFLSNFFPEEKEERILELLDVVELTDFAKTKVKFLSGGQKQRVALARALARDPELILLDEPFSHIDNFKKHHLRRRLFKYLKQKKITCLVATHDKEDVLGYSDNIIVLNDSKILANETPETLYRMPGQPLIAAFFGEFSTIDPYGIVYAHQLKIVDVSDISVVVTNSYFKGNYYLIEAEYKEKAIYFQHNNALNKSARVFIDITR
ncbi:ABC transporter ATP-binding protein [Hanstruepera flava]|uniref:ABC transporter ATP-binding protein n=1 Tax=Hanstruepera flava TaxID=2930218 RepID=UPI0020279121|nr:ABC transporter ATP-binding protein [Hanstruepera flava]